MALAEDDIRPSRGAKETRAKETRDLPVRDAAMGEKGNTMYGYAAVFNQVEEFWTREFGTIREKWAPGAFKKSLKDTADQVVVMFNHGQGANGFPLGRASVLREDSRGLYVEVPLPDTSYNRDLKELLRAGAINGMSTSFEVVQDSWNRQTEDGIPERTIREVKLRELGPVTYPAFPGTLAAIRSRQEAADTSDSAEGTDAAAPTDSEAAVTSAAEERQAQLVEAARAITEAAEERSAQLAEIQATFAEIEEELQHVE